MGGAGDDACLGRHTGSDWPCIPRTHTSQESLPIGILLSDQSNKHCDIISGARRRLTIHTVPSCWRASLCSRVWSAVPHAWHFKADPYL